MKATSMFYEQPTVLRIGSVAEILKAFIGERPKLKPETDWRIIKLKEFVDSHGGNVEDADPICKQLQLEISGRYAGLLFKRSIGIGLREYAMRQRINLAAERLRTTAKSIKEIAADAGYQRSAELCRRFKQTFQVSPTDYRRTWRAAEKITTAETRANLARRRSA
jgi:methylphosphotriester-DNA--protein-cysteine methyltransferase